MFSALNPNVIWTEGEYIKSLIYLFEYLGVVVWCIPVLEQDIQKAWRNRGVKGGLTTKSASDCLEGVDEMSLAVCTFRGIADRDSRESMVSDGG